MSPLTLPVLAPALVVLLFLVVRSVLRRSDRPSRTLLFAAMVLLPAVWLSFALVRADSTTKSVGFCLSCHEMEEYGRDLRSGDARSLASLHYVGRESDAGSVCFRCHSRPSVAGQLDAKLRGARDLWVHYFGDIPDTMSLIRPYPIDSTLAG